MRSHTKTNMHCPIYPRVDRCIQLPAFSKLAESISISDMVVMDQAKWTGMDMFVTDILHMDVQNNYCRTMYPNLSYNQEVHSQNPLDYTLPNTFLKWNEGRNQSCLFVFHQVHIKWLHYLKALLTLELPWITYWKSSLFLTYVNPLTHKSISHKV